MTVTAAGSQQTTLDHLDDLRSTIPAVRTQAAIELGRNPDKSAASALTRALKDPAPAVRREAAKALGAIKDSATVPDLMAALGDGDKNVRTYAAYALGEIRDDRATEALLKAFRDPEWCVRDQAAWALRELRDPGIAVPLVAMLKGQAADVATVGWLLKSLGDQVAIDSLQPLLRDHNAGTRLRAVRALNTLKSAAATDSLLTLLKDSDADVRFAAVQVLARSSDPRVTKTLKLELAGDKDPRIRGVVEELIRASSHEKDLAAWWSFDDRNPRVAKDVTGNGNDGEIKDAAVVDGKVGAALQFGPGKFVNLGKVPKLSMANSPLTVMAWIKTKAKTGVVVARGGAFCGFSLYLKEGTARFGIHRIRELPADIASAPVNIDGKWMHLAGVIKSDALELYVNGKLAATKKPAGLIPSNCGQGMEIGTDLGSSPAEIMDAFDGIIDEVKVYRAALSEEEIAEQCTPPKLTEKK